MLKIPVVDRPKSSIEKIGIPSTGFIYMIKKGSTTPMEKPLQQQNLEKDRAQVQLVIMKAVKRLSEEKGISRSEARKQLFKAPVKSADDEDPTNPIDSTNVTIDVSSNNEDKTNNEDDGEKDADDALVMYDYLKDDEAMKLLTVNSSPSMVYDDLRYGAVTLFINTRLLYTIKVSDRCDNDSGILHVDPLLFSVPKHSRLKIDNMWIETTHFTNEGSTQIKIKSGHKDLYEGDILFLCEHESMSLKQGEPEWTTALTKKEIVEPLIDEIFKFYLSEDSYGTFSDYVESDVAILSEDRDNEGESNSPSNNLLKEMPPIGQKSGSDSNGSIAESQNSNLGEAFAVSQ